MKRVIITLAIAVVLGGAGYGGYYAYGAGLSSGETEGYISGYVAGQEDGYASGTEDGYDTGQEEGYALGEEEGTAEGYQLGLAEGYESGKQDGYEEGVEDGLGHGYTLKDPTYGQAMAFLISDRTDLNIYNLDSYVCSHFSRDVCNNAEAAGYRCAFVELRYPDSGHAIVAFDTVDMGLVYFEPQTDERVIPAVGKRFYQCVIPNPGYVYPAPSYNDTIEDILVAW